MRRETEQQKKISRESISANINVQKMRHSDTSETAKELFNQYRRKTLKSKIAKKVFDKIS